MNPLLLIPAPYRLIAAGIAAALVLAVVLGCIRAYGSHHEAAGYARGHAEFTRLQADMTAKALKGEQDARNEEARTRAAVKENADEAQRLAARDRDAAAVRNARVAAAADRLRDDDAIIAARSGGGASGPGLAIQRAADLEALRGVFGACRARYADLAREADDELDDARRRGSECAADYDALTKTGAP